MTKSTFGFILGAVLLALGGFYSLKNPAPTAKIPDRFAYQGVQPDSASLDQLYRKHGVTYEAIRAALIKANDLAAQNQGVQEGTPLADTFGVKANE